MSTSGNLLYPLSGLSEISDVPLGDGLVAMRSELANGSLLSMVNPSGRNILKPFKSAGRPSNSVATRFITSYILIEWRLNSLMVAKN